MTEDVLRTLGPQVLGILVRRGHDFAAVEDAVQEALLEAHVHWSDDVPPEPLGWLILVAQRKLVDAHRSQAARRRREDVAALAPAPGQTEHADDTLLLLFLCCHHSLFLCCHHSLSPASAVALTLRAVGGLTTRQIAEAFVVPEATMAQRISRAKRTVAGQRLARPADVAVVLRVLYLMFNEGYAGSEDLADEAIRLCRLLLLESPEPEVGGLLALMLLHDARRAARVDDAGALVPLDEQDRTRWDTARIAEGVGVLMAALDRDRLGEYQAQAAVAALHCDARSAEETDWPQVLEWYDGLLALGDNPLARLSRAVAVGQVDGPLVGLAALDGLDERLPGHHRLHAVRAHLHERAGDRGTAARLYALAAHHATSVLERDHLAKQAARLASHL